MTTANEDLDRRAMQRLTAGHDTGLNELMERHGPRLFHYLLRMTRDAEEAKDLAQESFVRVYHRRSAYRPDQKFSTWLYAIATNLARDRLRWRQRHPHVSLQANREGANPPWEEKLQEPAAHPGETVLAAERGECVRNAVAALPEDLRLPLILAEYEGYSHAEIGEILRCTAKAVEMRIYRARQALRKGLKPLLE